MQQLTADQLVEEAERMKMGKPIILGYIDDKADFGAVAITTLVAAWAEIRHLNSMTGQNYYTEVGYKGYAFISVTEQPLELTR